MYQNSLHDLVDASKNFRRLKADENMHDADMEDARTLCKSIKELAEGSMCFFADYDEVPEIRINAELVRLPFKKCWFEFDFGGPVRIAFLCEEIQKGFKTLIFLRNDSANWIFCNGVTTKISEKNQLIQCEKIGKSLERMAQYFDIFYKYLSALNCCNITRTERKPKPSQQSVRRALGRQPLFSTWTLEIDLQRTEQEMPGQGGTHASPRLHLRRGHARQHRPGQWCWVQPHVVGDKSLGMIHKDYASH